MAEANKIIICADDYAQNNAISEGILALAEAKRINAISCLVNSDTWIDAHQGLNKVKNTCLIGLHFNLTLGQALSSEWKKQVGTSFSSLPQLLQNVYLGRLDRKVVTAEIVAQLEAFTSVMQVEPQFIDGHQHIHQLPIIRDALLAVYSKFKLTSFFRNTSNDWRDFFCLESFPKCQLIALLGGRVFKRRLVQQLIPSNTSFAGIYNFSKASDYPYYFKRFLTKSKDGGLIMCHPGNESNDVSDPLHQYRHFELNYLMSDAFLRDLEDNSVQLK